MVGEVGAGDAAAVGAGAAAREAFMRGGAITPRRGVEADSALTSCAALAELRACALLAPSPGVGSLRTWGGRRASGGGEGDQSVGTRLSQRHARPTRARATARHSREELAAEADERGEHPNAVLRERRVRLGAVAVERAVERPHGLHGRVRGRQVARELARVRRVGGPPPRAKRPGSVRRSLRKRGVTGRPESTDRGGADSQAQKRVPGSVTMAMRSTTRAVARQAGCTAVRAARARATCPCASHATLRRAPISPLPRARLTHSHDAPSPPPPAPVQRVALRAFSTKGGAGDSSAMSPAGACRAATRHVDTRARRVVRRV